MQGRYNPSINHLVLLAISIGAVFPSSKAQETVLERNITVRISTENRTLEEARNLAIQNARNEALKRAFGTSINSKFFVQQEELILNGKVEEANNYAVQFISERSSGRVLKDTVIYESMDNVSREGTQPRWDYVITINALVIKEKESPDPDFSLSINGIRDSYRHGEELNFIITSTKNCYVNIFGLGHDGRIYYIFPNSYDVNNSLVAGIPRKIPSSSAYSLSLELIDEKQRGSEKVFVVATKDSAIFMQGEAFKPGVGYGEMRRSTLEHLMEWILAFKRDRICEATESYVIRR